MNKTARVILAAVLVWIVGTVFAGLTCGWLFNWVYEIPPVIAKSAEAMLAPGNFAISLAIGLLISFIWVIVFAVLYKGIPGKGYKKGMMYGLLTWAIGALSGIIGMPLFMTISWALAIYWIIQALVVNVVNGAIIGAIYKP